MITKILFYEKDYMLPNVHYWVTYIFLHRAGARFVLRIDGWKPAE